MDNKFKLTNVVLYAKGWYLHTNDIWDDLTKILELDGYNPQNKMDIYNIIINSFETLPDHIHWKKFNSVIIGISPNNLQYIGYKCKEYACKNTHEQESLPSYHPAEAFVYYVISNLKFLDTQYWNPKMPRVTKYPRNPDVTIFQLNKSFGHLYKKEMV